MYEKATRVREYLIHNNKNPVFVLNEIAEIFGFSYHIVEGIAFIYSHDRELNGLVFEIKGWKILYRPRADFDNLTCVFKYGENWQHIPIGKYKLLDPPQIYDSLVPDFEYTYLNGKLIRIFSRSENRDVYDMVKDNLVKGIAASVAESKSDS